MDDSQLARLVESLDQTSEDKYFEFKSNPQAAVFKYAKEAMEHRLLKKRKKEERQGIKKLIRTVRDSARDSASS